MPQSLQPTALDEDVFWKELSQPDRLHFSYIAALAKMDRPAREAISLEPAVVAIILKVSEKALQNARRIRKAALAKPKEEKALEKIDPIELESIAVKAMPSHTRSSLYSGDEVYEYALRLNKLSSRKIVPMYPKRMARAGAPIGFHKWLELAGPGEEDAWTFAIQPNGRPMDLIAAIVSGSSTKIVEELTVRQFCQRLADAASRSGSSRENAQLLSATPLAKKRPAARPSSNLEKAP